MPRTIDGIEPLPEFFEDDEVEIEDSAESGALIDGTAEVASMVMPGYSEITNR